MLGWIFSIFKWTLFAVVVLVAGQLVEWRNRPISDHIRSTLAHFDAPHVPARVPTLPELPSAASLSQKLQIQTQRAERFSKEERARLDNILSGQARHSN
jgi:hypothetical protein